MNVHPLAGQRAPADSLIEVSRLERDYYSRRPDLSEPRQLVSFGTSGHRGRPQDGSFTEAHILAITQAICDGRRVWGIHGPLFLGKDTHALSAAAERTALEVLAANGVETFIQENNGFTPTPAISRAILVHNHGRATGRADGIVVTPSHNPPDEGGLKYNPPHGGPAETEVTSWIQQRANELLQRGNRDVRRRPDPRVGRTPGLHSRDFVRPYVEELARVLDLDAVRASRVRVGVDPLGGAALGYWEAVQARYGLDLTVVNPKLDPTFGFMPLDHDGRIRMDCSSRFAMAGLVGLKDRFDVAFGNDPDADRHGIVTRAGGLMNPNHYLAVAIHYLLGHRPDWPPAAVVGKTMVSSSLIDRVVHQWRRGLAEVPVGFKWFARSLFDGSCCFAGEESAGASFLCWDGAVWTTDKDGLLLGLLAAEILARTGRDPWQHYQELTARLGDCWYVRLDTPADAATKERLLHLRPETVPAGELAGEPVLACLTRAPANHAPLGGLKVIAAGGWFAVRPSGTEQVIKLYAESFRSEAHLQHIVAQARQLLAELAPAG